LLKFGLTSSVTTPAQKKRLPGQGFSGGKVYNCSVPLELRNDHESARPPASVRTSASNGQKLPPGPKGRPFFGIAFEFARDPLGTLERVAQEYGDIAYFRLGPQRRIALNHPDLITQVLIVQQSKFHKSELALQLLSGILGQGLLISEGDFWRRQRRLAQPAFRRSRMNDYAPTMVAVAQEHIRNWRNKQVSDISAEMMALTLEVAVRALFGATLPGEADAVGRATTFLMHYQVNRMRRPVRLPESWPSARNRRAVRERELLDKLVYRIIAQKKEKTNACPFHEGSASPAGHDDDVLSLLMSAMDEDGSQMTLQQLRDETMTLFLAGHETTALALSWSWYLLSENPEAEARLHEELHGVLGGRAPETADLPRLPYLRGVVFESLRLYPPAALLSRLAVAPFSLAGYDFPVGTTLLMTPWVLHRDARFFDDPGAFRPERWLNGLEDRLPQGAYLPFGDGPRRCIGQDFAILDAMLVIAIIAQQFRLRLVAGPPIETELLVTLRPKQGIKMMIQERS
jgi:cytochrome P450